MDTSEQVKLIDQFLVKPFPGLVGEENDTLEPFAAVGVVIIHAFESPRVTKIVDFVLGYRSERFVSVRERFAIGQNCVAKPKNFFHVRARSLTDRQHG